MEETGILKKEKDELFKTYQLKMMETQEYVNKILKKEEESNVKTNKNLTFNENIYFKILGLIYGKDHYFRIRNSARNL